MFVATSRALGRLLIYLFGSLARVRNEYLVASRFSSVSVGSVRVVRTVKISRPGHSKAMTGLVSVALNALAGTVSNLAHGKCIGHVHDRRSGHIMGLSLANGKGDTCCRRRRFRHRVVRRVGSNLSSSRVGILVASLTGLSSCFGIMCSSSRRGRCRG